MSYVALYRKFRPNDFGDVKGQDHIVTALRNQITSDRIGHAYLFSGTRGTGKTTIAKIFAKAANCLNPGENGPCNECEMCKAINNQTSLNVTEIDAASNNGVDNIRQIVDEVAYSPTEGKYKVYIIDEVHMLSGGAFNALLKTLEEPPSYVIFILATTEAHKIPVTILSRCQRYEFKRMKVETIVSRIEELMEREGISADEKAVKYIAKCADGAMRDALSLLDQCISFHYGEKLTYENVLEVLGAVDIDIFVDMLTCIMKGEVSRGIKVIESIILDGKDLNQFVINFTWFLRNLMLVKSTENTMDLVDVGEEKLLELRKVSVDVDMDVLMRYIRIFSELSNQLKYATQKRVLLEAAFIKMCKPQMEDNVESLLNRIDILEKKLESGVVVTGTQGAGVTGAAYGMGTTGGVSGANGDNQGTASAGVNAAGDASGMSSAADNLTPQRRAELVKALPDEIKELARNWQMVINKTPIYIRESLKMATPFVAEDGTLILMFEDNFAYSSVSTEIHMAQISNIIVSIINKDVNIKTQFKSKATDVSDNMVNIASIINAEITYEN